MLTGGGLALEHFYRQFTIIDFLSMFIPGAATILLINITVLPLVSPWSAFFPSGSTIGLSISFIVLSYLAGHIICQITKPLEKLSCFVCTLSQMRSAYTPYAQQKAAALGLTSYLPALGDDQVQELFWRRIYYFTLNRSECSRLRLMHGFYGLFRSLTGTSILAILCLLWYGHTQLHCLIIPVLCCLAASLLFLYRALKFYKVYLETMFETFLLIAESTGRPAI